MYVQLFFLASSREMRWVAQEIITAFWEAIGLYKAESIISLCLFH